MKTITTLLKRLASSSSESKEISNPSNVLRVHRDDISGTLEIRNLNGDYSPLRISWIKQEDATSMKPVWVNEEMMIL